MQLTSVVVNDRTTPTPVAVTFQPAGDPTNAGASILVTTDPVPLARKVLNFVLKRSNAKYRFTMGLKIPVVVNEVVNGVTSPKVVRTSYGKVEFTFDETSTEQERNDMVGLIANSLASSQAVIHASVVKLEGTW